jgi:hypothetical protein
LECISCGLSAAQEGEFIGQSHQNCFDHFIEAFILGDDEVSPELRFKIASLQNLVTLEDETAFSPSTVTSPCKHL